MKHFSLLASFVAPSIRKQSTQFGTVCSRNCSPAFHPLGKFVSGNISSRSSSTSLALGSETLDASIASTMEQPSGVYEAVLPQTETLVGMGIIVVLCVVLYWVWENQVVPVSRSKLAISKSRGEVKEYLDELKASSSTPNPPLSSELMSETAQIDSVEDSSLFTNNIAADGTVSPVTETFDNEKIAEDQSLSSSSTTTTQDRAFERWLFTDWLIDNKSEKKAGRKKDPALPILKNAKWNSGDNPVVVAAFLMLVGIVFTTLTERITTFG